jgi:hypothetical protein
VRQVGIERDEAGISHAARVEPAELVRRADAELAGPDHHADPMIGGGAGRQQLERAIARIVVDDQDVAAGLEPEQAVEHRVDRAALVVGADKDQRIAGLSRRRKLRIVRSRRQCGSPEVVAKR